MAIDNIYEVNFDSRICISMEQYPCKRMYDPNQVLYFKFQFLCKNMGKWPLYREICQA